MAATAALLPGDQGRALTRYPAPPSAATARKVVKAMTTPVLRDVRFAGPRLRCRDTAVLSDGHPRGGGNAPACRRIAAAGGASGDFRARVACLAITRATRLRAG